jgi:SAM-dependent methyltransferase
MTVGGVRAAFDPVRACWICDGTTLTPVHELIFELSAYAVQDPELASDTGSRLPLCRCARCGFAQPAALPALPRYFDRMYDQRWSDDWIRNEFESEYKDGIFSEILTALTQRLSPGRRRLLDVGAHAGRFVWLAGIAGWTAEGLELNPKTAACAARRTGAPIRQLNVHDAAVGDGAFDAITLTDVLEHIPDPVRVLRRSAALLAPDGWAAVKVPCGPSQLLKETWRGRLLRRYRPTLADNLVHVGHFSPRSLQEALERAGFVDVEVGPAAPELPATPGLRGALSRGSRRAIHRAACLLPGGLHSPLTLNLQAYGRRPAEAREIRAGRPEGPRY